MQFPKENDTDKSTTKPPSPPMPDKEQKDFAEKIEERQTKVIVPDHKKEGE
jgi:hypothetical protein